MSLWKRLSMIFKAKANKALDSAENINETLDYSYTKQVEMLAKVRRGVADVATSRRRVEMQRDQLQGQADKLQQQAEAALNSGREDLAREALTRKAGLTSQIQDLTGQVNNLRQEEEKLIAAQQKLSTKVEGFRTKKETLKANHAAAEATAKIGEVFAGISDDGSSDAIQRAEDKVLQMQARGSAVDELANSGALDSLYGPSDSLTRELEVAAAASSVDDEIARLKAMSAPKTPQALES